MRQDRPREVLESRSIIVIKSYVVQFLTLQNDRFTNFKPVQISSVSTFAFYH